MRSVQKASSHILWKIETLIEEDTRHKKHCTQDNDTSDPFKVGSLGPHTDLPVAISCPVIFFWISAKVWNLFPFKGDFSFGKSQKSQGTKSGLYGGWVTWVIWCFAKKLCMRCNAWAGALSWWSWQSPVVHSCGLLCLDRFHGGIFKCDTELLLYLLSHFECNGHTVHMLNQWHLLPPLTSTVKLSLFTHVHSSPVSLAARLHWCHANCSHYINNGWTFSRQIWYFYTVALKNWKLIKNIIAFIITQRKKKYVGGSLIKYVQDLPAENYKMIMKEMKYLING